MELNKKLFGDNFIWGVSASAPQTEGAHDIDGRGLSIWDTFSQQRKRILSNHTPSAGTDFYHRYRQDIAILHYLNVPNFRFSFSWPRIFPEGTGKLSEKGIAFYHRVIDECLERNIQPWVTLYHWDLPETLEQKGGWANREILNWFEEYVSFCVRTFKDKVKYWMVLNEPMTFVGAGHYLGIHAPGKRGLKNFLPALHHAVLCQSLGRKIIKNESPSAEAGTTFSCSFVAPHSNSEKDIKAAKRVDALLNRIFVEALVGKGYPVAELPFLKKLEKYFRNGDEQLMKADLDFAGVQVYTREIVSHSYFTPYLNAKLVPARKRKVFHTAMDWEVYPESIYEIIKQFNAYNIPKIIITENGAAFDDKLENGSINDGERMHYIQHHIKQMLRAKKDGYKADGYFVWSLTDNFEWAKGYHPRFGLVHVNYETQERIIKESGHWYKKFLMAEK